AVIIIVILFTRVQGLKILCQQGDVQGGIGQVAEINVAGAYSGLVSADIVQPEAVQDELASAVRHPVRDGIIGLQVIDPLPGLLKLQVRQVIYYGIIQGALDQYPSRELAFQVGHQAAQQGFQQNQFRIIEFHVGKQGVVFAPCLNVPGDTESGHHVFEQSHGKVNSLAFRIVGRRYQQVTDGGFIECELGHVDVACDFRFG